MTADQPDTPSDGAPRRPDPLRGRRRWADWGLGSSAFVESASARLSGHGPQLRGSLWLILAVMTNAGGGFLFWLVAARVDDSSDFGKAASLFTAVLFVNYATSLGLPVAIARYAPGPSESSRRLFNWALLASFSSSLAGAMVTLAVLPDDVVAPLWRYGRPAGIGLFVLSVAGLSFTVLGEVRLMALRRWGWVLWRAGLVAAVRIPLLWWRPIDSDVLWLFLLVAGIPALSGYLLAAALAQGGGGLVPLPRETRAAVRFSTVNYLGLLAIQAPQFALPVIVLVHVSPTTMASFYVAFSITTVVFLIPHTLGQVLLVEGGRDERNVRSQVKLGILLGVSLMALATVAATLLSSTLTSIYGEAFRSAAEVLPWLVAAAVPWAITSILLTSVRLAEARLPTLAITGTLAAATLVPALILTPERGVDGAAAAWIIGNGSASVVAVLVGRQFLRVRPVPSRTASSPWSRSDPIGRIRTRGGGPGSRHTPGWTGLRRRARR